MKNPKKKSIRKTFRLIHLYLGLITGIVVFIVSITGCCWVFQSEIKSIIEEEIKVAPQNQPKLSPTQAKSISEEIIPDKKIHGIQYSNDPSEPLEIVFYEAEPLFYQSLLLNPYTGAQLAQINHRDGFFSFVLDGHLYLWLPRFIGKHIVGYGTLIFLFSVITGVVLWWPKKKKNRKQRFKLDWNEKTRWKRKNFDLHTVLGFYASALALVFAVTGLVMALNWFYYLYYLGIGGTSEMRFVVPDNISKPDQAGASLTAIDRLPQLLASRYPDAANFEIHYPDEEDKSYYVHLSKEEGVYYNSDYRYYDRFTLEEIPSPSIYGVYADADTQDTIMRMNYEIHIGAILGLPGKIIAFLASILIASLPVTGILLWVGRKKKSRDKKTIEREKQYANYTDKTLANA